MAKVSKREAKKVIKEEPKALVLSHDEHLKVETLPIQIENARLLLAVEEQSLVNMLLEAKILEAKIQKQKEIIGQCHLKYNQEKKRHSEIIGQIMKNHSLESDKFSYNNETGEIIL